MDEKYLEMAELASAAEVTAGLARAKISQVKPEDFNGECECLQPVPPERIKLGYYNCVPCQTRKEREAQIHGRK